MAETPETIHTDTQIATRRKYVRLLNFGVACIITMIGTPTAMLYLGVGALATIAQVLTLLSVATTIFFAAAAQVKDDYLAEKRRGGK